MDSKEEFAEIMTKLTIAFNVQASSSRTSIYWEELQGYSIERLRQSASEAIRSCNMFPSISELIRFMPPPEEPKLLTEPPPTQDELTYGQWQCRFAIWLMGKKKVGEEKIRTPRGCKMRSIYKETRPQWKEAKDKEGRQRLWREFCQQADVPERVASVRIN